MLLFKHIFYISLISLATYANACNSSEHHSVLSHYNHAEKIFEGKVLMIGHKNKKKQSFVDKNTGVKSIFIKFEIIKNYKKSKVKEQIIIGLLPNLMTDLKIGCNYLIYAFKDLNQDFLVFEKGISISDTSNIQKHQFLFQIPPEHNGYIIEYSKYGRKWAEGELKNGLAVGEWKYFALSGELQIKGFYEAGEEINDWLSFFHTADRDYHILNDIISGIYYTKFNSYKVIKIDTTLKGIYKNQLAYQVGNDTMVEAFFYAKPIVSKKIQFLNGLRHGTEQKYNEKGDCMSSYTFKNGILEGDFFELHNIRTLEKSYLKVEGVYKSDKKLSENHLFFQNKTLIRKKEIIRNGKTLSS
ncbi:MAG: hypothetical protein MK207_00040 [Saprospiraceae bacterium]|nr:hypothetical protein [Saprospiraceae bacterium]